MVQKRQLPLKSIWVGVTVTLISLSAITLVALHNPAGWFFFSAALVSLLLHSWPARRQLGLITLAIASLALTPISTDLAVNHAVVMTLGTFGPVILTYLILEKYFHDGVVRFRFIVRDRKWYRGEFAYIGVTAVLGYFMLPLYFHSTGQYANWNVVLQPGDLLALFGALMLTGFWDELFFIATVLGVYRKHLPFWWANIAQAVVFTSFLYDLGFRSWGFIPAFIFALIQGYVFQRTGSLLYAITIHLVFDLVLFFVLVHEHFPDVLPFFVT